MIKQKYIDLLRVEPGKKIHLNDYDTGWAQTEEIKEFGKDKLKERANEILQQNLADLTQVQQLLYADDRYSLLIVFQAMDAAGKDGTIKHVMSGVNPQGCQVFSFKKPSDRRIGSQLSLALHEKPAGKRPDRYLQPLILRGRTRG